MGESRLVRRFIFRDAMRYEFAPYIRFTRSCDSSTRVTHDRYLRSSYSRINVVLMHVSSA